jgi:4-amino-4-deoxy-L-arabinose transferase-like glycosyltransferase
MPTSLLRMRRWIEVWWDALLLAIVGAAFLLTNLDAALLEPDESRYAEIPRLMLRSGDWITPKLQGKAYNDKPPLVYWLIAGSYQIFGVDIASARIVPAVAGWLMLLSVYAWTRRYLGRGSAGWTATILLSMTGFAAMTRMLLLDGPFALLVVGALLSGYHALAQRLHAGWWLISAILCGLAVLAKGPVAVVLVCPCLFVLRWLDRGVAVARWRDILGYGLLMLLIAAPWYGAMLATNETFGSEHFWRHHLRRFLDPAHHERPFWYYFPVLFLELLPWPFLAIPVWRRWRAWSGPERFMMIFSLWCFLFFSVARAKLPTYLLPLLPTLSVVLGKQISLLLAGGRQSGTQQAGVGLLLGALLLVVSAREWVLHWTLEQGTPRVDGIALAAAAAVLAWIVFRGIGRIGRGKERFWLHWGMPGGLACLAALWLTHRVIPEFSESASVVPYCTELVQRAEREEISYAAYRNSWDAVSFALRGEELEVFSSREWEQFLNWLTRQSRCQIWMRDYENRIEEFAKSLPPGWQIEQQMDFGRMQALVLKKMGKGDVQTVSQNAAPR